MYSMAVRIKYTLNVFICLIEIFSMSILWHETIEQQLEHSLQFGMFCYEIMADCIMRAL